DRYLAPYNSAVDALPRIMADAHAAAVTTADKNVLDQIDGVITRKMAELNETIRLWNAGSKQEAVRLVNTDTGKTLMDQARDLATILVDHSNAAIAARTSTMRRGADLLQVSSILGAILVICLLIGVGRTIFAYLVELRTSAFEVETLNRELENRVEQRTAELKRANDEIQRFAYIISHDLRSPLVNIMGFTTELDIALAALQGLIKKVEAEQSTLLDDGARLAAGQDIPEALGFIRASTAKMDRLINAILRLSREGRRSIHAEDVNVTALVQTIADSVRHQTIDAGAELTVAPDLPALRSDRLIIEQIFGNLIDNAIKYLRTGMPGRISITGRSLGKFAIYEIADNGRGIDAADHERIFELFRRSGPQDRPGEGIGLAYVRTLVRRLGGEITVASTLGRGTTFQLTVPRVVNSSLELKS
ncbi:MAG: ATP-binding protein, partial [Dongiaceae bacterium]